MPTVALDLSSWVWWRRPMKLVCSAGRFPEVAVAACVIQAGRLLAIGHRVTDDDFVFCDDAGEPLWGRHVMEPMVGSAGYVSFLGAAASTGAAYAKVNSNTRLLGITSIPSAGGAANGSPLRP